MLLEISPPIEESQLDRSPADCRVYERMTCELPTTCQPASLLAMREPGWTAIIRDISQGGVRLHVARRFEKGTPLAIELPGDKDHDASVVFVNVVNVARMEVGIWVLGCRFMSELGEDEMQRLLTHESSPSLDAVEQYQADPDAEPAVQAAVAPIVETRILPDVQVQIALDVGCQIRFQFKRFNATRIWPLAPGKIVRLNGKGSNQSTWSLKVQLTECRQDGDVWHLNAKLLHTPNVTALLQALATAR